MLSIGVPHGLGLLLYNEKGFQQPNDIASIPEVLGRSCTFVSIECCPLQLLEGFI